MSSQNSSSSTTSGDSSKDHFAYITRQCVVYFYFFTILAAVIMNSVVLLAMYFDKRLHNANKYLVACLAVSDLLVAMFSVTIRLHQYLQPDVPLTIHSCRFWIWVDIFTETASITTLTIISIDRYFKVAKPFQYKTVMSTKKSGFIIIFLWVYSGVISLLGFVPYKDYKGIHLTTENKCVNDNKAFYTLAALLGFFIPVIILIIMCALMFRIVKRFHRRRSTRHQDIALNSTMIPRVHNAGANKRTNSSRRTVGIFSLVVLTFIICWGPFFSLFLIFQYSPRLLSVHKKGYKILSMICFNILPYTNSFLNPIIYAYFDKSFNVAIRDLLRRIKGKPRSGQNTSYALVHVGSCQTEIRNQ